jgi:hypothetical protein
MSRFAITLVLLAVAAPAAGQQAIQTDAATQPAKGVWLLRTQFRLDVYDDDPLELGREGESYTVFNSLSYGVTGDVSVTASLPVTYESFDAGDEVGQGDAMAMLKWRVWQRDTGPIDTMRFSLLGGASLPTGEESFTSDGVDPMLGGTFTAIRGRHGFTSAAVWRFNTAGDEFAVDPVRGDNDTLSYDAAYLYRLEPAEYAADTTAAWYGVIEANGVYDAGGGHELMLSPGLLYEGRDFAAELSVQLPAISDLDDRPDREFGLTIGFRWLF